MRRNCLPCKLFLISSSCHSAIHSEFPTYVFSRLCIASYSCCYLFAQLRFDVYWCYHFYRTWTRLPFSVSSWPSPSVQKADPLNNVISCISPFILLTNLCPLPVQPFQLHAANQPFLCQVQDELLEIRNLARMWPWSLLYMTWIWQAPGFCLLEQE